MKEKQSVFVTSRELSAIISLPVFTIRKLTREGVFPAYKVTGKGYLFKLLEIVEIIEKMKV